MKIRKLIGSFAGLCLLVLTLVVGVIAATSARVDVTGNINYTALGNVKATLEISHTATNAIGANKTGGVVNSDVFSGATGKIIFNGTETTASGNFTLSEGQTPIELTATSGATELFYAYTLKITNNFTDAEMADKKALKITFTEPQTNAFVSATYTKNYTLTPSTTETGLAKKSVILAPGASILITITFKVSDINISANANLASSLVLETDASAGENFDISTEPALPAFAKVKAFETPFAKSAGADGQAGTADDETYPYYIQMGTYSGVDIPWIIAGATTAADFGDGNTCYGTTPGSTTVMCTNVNQTAGLFTYNAADKQIYVNGAPATKLFLISQYGLMEQCTDAEYFFGSSLNTYMNSDYNVSEGDITGSGITNGSLMYNMGFSAEMANLVVATNIQKTSVCDNVLNQSYNTILNKTAKFFLLGWNGTSWLNMGDSFGVCRYFGSNTNGSDSYKMANRLTATDLACDWWLRSGVDTQTMYIPPTGNIELNYSDTSICLFLRPAFVMDVTVAGESGGSGTETQKPYTVKTYADDANRPVQDLTNGYDYVHYVEMGEYPQRFVSADLPSGTSATAGADGYFLNTTTNTKYAFVSGTGYYLVEPVKWTVVGVTDGAYEGGTHVLFTTNNKAENEASATGLWLYDSLAKTFKYRTNTTSGWGNATEVLVLSEYGLTHSQFNSVNYKNNRFSQCSVYTTLNSTLYNQIFSERQKTKIVAKSMPITTYNSVLNSIEDAEIMNNLFILGSNRNSNGSSLGLVGTDSYNISSYFIPQNNGELHSNLIAKETAFSSSPNVGLANSSTTKPEDYAAFDWWLRSGEYSSGMLQSSMIINKDGSVTKDYVTNFRALRPAFVLNLA